MKLRITDRKGLLTEFNRCNCTEHPASKYVGVRVYHGSGWGLEFRPVNGSGFFNVGVDESTTGLCVRKEGFEPLESYLEFA
jgi:hypothetical protein